MESVFFVTASQSRYICTYVMNFTETIGVFKLSDDEKTRARQYWLSILSNLGQHRA